LGARSEEGAASVEIGASHGGVEIFEHGYDHSATEHGAGDVGARRRSGGRVGRRFGRRLEFGADSGDAGAEPGGIFGGDFDGLAVEHDGVAGDAGGEVQGAEGIETDVGDFTEAEEVGAEFS
jgi:hypothetical protein